MEVNWQMQTRQGSTKGRGSHSPELIRRCKEPTFLLENIHSNLETSGFNVSTISGWPKQKGKGSCPKKTNKERVLHALHCEPVSTSGGLTPSGFPKEPQAPWGGTPPPKENSWWDAPPQKKLWRGEPGEKAMQHLGNTSEKERCKVKQKQRKIFLKSYWNQQTPGQLQRPFRKGEGVQGSLMLQFESEYRTYPKSRQ